MVISGRADDDRRSEQEEIFLYVISASVRDRLTQMWWPFPL